MIMHSLYKSCLFSCVLWYRIVLWPAQSEPVQYFPVSIKQRQTEHVVLFVQVIYNEEVGHPVFQLLRLMNNYSSLVRRLSSALSHNDEECVTNAKSLFAYITFSSLINNISHSYSFLIIFSFKLRKFTSAAKSTGYVNLLNIN